MACFQFKEAQELYLAEIGKPFHYDHCWEMLRNNPRWESTLSNNKRRTTRESNSVTSDTINLGDNGDSSANQDRPLGRKASKELLKDKEKADGSNLVSIFTPEFWERKEKHYREKAERQERTLRQHQQQLDLQQAYYEMSIIGRDTSGMSSEEASYYEKLKQEILKRRRI